MASSSTTTVVVVTGGDPLTGVVLPPLPADAPVVAADSGVDRAHELGLTVALAVGDFDSATPGALDAARRDGAEVRVHPVAKDATDLELALGAALELEPRPDRLVVLGGHGGRLDHLLANALLLASDVVAGVEVVAQMGHARVTVVRHRGELTGRVGDLVTLLPVGGPARGVATEGLRYPLRDEDLAPGTTRGVSNELVAPAAVVTVRAGVLLAVQPGPTLEAGPRTTPEP
jgi:thiamine pyrophosphokinase